MVAQPTTGGQVMRLPAVVRAIHPAPALAVTALSAALGAILLSQAGLPIGSPWLLMVVSVSGSQVFTGVANDIADRERDALARPEKPIPAGELSVETAVWVASAALAVQLVTSLWLGPLPMLLGAVASASALAYDLALSRTPYSAIPYLVSFGLLPAWIASAVGVPLERVVPAMPLLAPFAVAAHLANTIRDWQADAAGGSRSMAQMLGREASRRLAMGLALAVGIGLAAAFLLGGRATPASVGLALGGLLAVTASGWSERRLWYGILVAAVCWTAAWALATG
jgi:4-hydroxybenzoate polyprenyltransferase